MEKEMLKLKSGKKIKAMFEKDERNEGLGPIYLKGHTKALNNIMVRISGKDIEKITKNLELLFEYLFLVNVRYFLLTILYRIYLGMHLN
jgi:hypothetical protein